MRLAPLLLALAITAPAHAASRENYKAWRSKATELEELRHAENASEQEIDLLRYQIQEIDAANLTPEDEQDLEDRWRRASNSTRLVETAANAVAALVGDDGVLARLADGRIIVGLPGAPQSALAGLVTLAAPIIRALRGETQPTPPILVYRQAGRDFAQ